MPPSDPARLCIDDFVDAQNVLGGVVDVIDHAGLDAIEHPREHRPR